MPRVISREQVKLHLGITDISYDPKIDAKLPFIDSKVKQITRRNWNDRVIGRTVNGSNLVTVTEYDNGGYDYIMDMVEVGMQLTGEGIPADSYITDIYPKGTANNDQYPLIELNNNVTASANDAAIFLGFPIAYHDIVAKGVWFLIGGTSTTNPSRTVVSKSIGSVNVNYDQGDNKIDGMYGMPSWFVKGLPRYARGF